MPTRLLLTLVAGCLLISACGDDSASDATTASTSATTPVATDPPMNDTVPPESAGSLAPTSDAPVLPGDASSITSACDLLTADDLVNKPFFVDEPTAEANDYGEGFIECIWTGDFEQHEVRVTLLPADSFQDDFGAAVPLDIAGLDTGGGVLYDQLLGIGRVGAGTTVVYTVGDRVIMVAVRTGEDGSPAAERPMAIELGNIVLSRL